MVRFFFFFIPLLFVLGNLPQERTQQQLIRTRPLLMINLERLAQKSLALLARHLGRIRLSARISNLENRLQLAAIREGVRSREHFHDEAA